MELLLACLYPKLWGLLLNKQEFPQNLLAEVCKRKNGRGLGAFGKWEGTKSVVEGFCEELN
jgi:hypothetical protein